MMDGRVASAHCICSIRNSSTHPTWIASLLKLLTWICVKILPRCKCHSCVCAKSGKRCTTCLPAWRGNCQNHMLGDPALCTIANDQENEPRTNEITTPDHLTSCPREEDVPLSEASENYESVCHCHAIHQCMTLISDGENWVKKKWTGR